MVFFLLMDLDAIFDNGDFAVATVGTEPISAIFDAPFKAASPETGMVESSAPAATVKSSDVTACSIVHGTSIAISGTPGGQYDGTYTVIGIEPDGQGMTRLILEES
jgi:hypothetical protein